MTYMALAPAGLLFVDALWDMGEGRAATITTGLLYVVSALAAIILILYFPAFSAEEQTFLRRGFGALLIVLLAYLFYYLGLLKGGADAKAFMSIGLLVPAYPSLGPFPLIPLEAGVAAAFEVFFPFALSVLMNSAVLLLALPAYFLGRNVLRGDFRWPQALLGYKARIDHLSPFVWLLQEAHEGGVRYYAYPRRDPRDADLDGLKRLGIDRVWVTPKIPLLLPMAAGYVLTFLVGNLLLALL
jgi:preflagellin peptidase FlaK